VYIQFSIPGRSSLDVVSVGTQYDEADRKFVDDSASTVIFPFENQILKCAPGEAGLEHRSLKLERELLCVFVECFTSTTLPATNVGRAMRVSCQIGKFHGMMAGIGPSGRSDNLLFSIAVRSICCHLITTTQLLQ
jgi:hypothetical protein